MPAPRRQLAPGAAGDRLRAGFRAIREEHGVAMGTDPAALAEARDAAAAWDRAGRRDLTGLDFVTLDPPGSTDLDQAMHLSRRGPGYRVRYAIADVAAFVRPGGAIDHAARRRATTVYCPDTRVPLHPTVLSEGAASLLPGGERPAVVWTIDLDADGEVESSAVERAVVRSRAQLDYPSEQARLVAGTDPEDPLTLLAEIGTRRRRLEAARGGVSLGRPEQDVIPTDDGWTLVLAAPLPVEELNAQLSLLTGMVAAELMLQAGVGVLRTMPAATGQDLARLRRQAAALGVPWPAGLGYADLLGRVDRDDPAVAAFLVAATRLFRGAAWTAFHGEPPADRVHGAIGAPYAHVTAPLRRLVDRYGTEAALAAAEGRPVPGWVTEALAWVGERMAAGAALAASADRACTDLVEATLLEHRVGETFDGIALDERTVQLADPAVVARLDRPTDDGHRVRVRLVAADPERRAVTFTPLGSAARP